MRPLVDGKKLFLWREVFGLDGPQPPPRGECLEKFVSSVRGVSHNRDCPLQGPVQVMKGWQIAANHLLSRANDMLQSVLVLGSGSSVLDDLNRSPSSCDGALVCVGPRRWRARGGERRQMEMCILCHEVQEILPDGAAMVLAAFVQRSPVMSKNRKRPPHNPKSYDPLFMHPDLSFGTHTGSCGHIMHSHCWQRYFETLQNQDAQWLHEQSSYDVENGEYLCPLCKCRSNTVIPLLPLTETTCSYSNSEQPGLAHWLNTTCQQIRGLHSAHKRAKQQVSLI
ncbi:E3 ubiquitin-protein ligase UBR2-like, partial [Ictalurus punctatus]|uniref:E3 ubiquitin-protein ligase n=1 Tax=Ictalurus punctatus TaxID=7998 RepID=A0A9F7RDL1_ICTPU